MTDIRFPSIGRLIFSIFLCTSAVGAACLASAQTQGSTAAAPDQKKQMPNSDLADLQARIDQRQKETAGRIETLNNKLESVSKTLEDMKRTQAESKAAEAPWWVWACFAGLGAVSIVAWAWVSKLREDSRRAEAENAATRSDPETINAELRKRIDSLEKVLSETLRDSVPAAVLKQFVQPKP